MSQNERISRADQLGLAFVRTIMALNGGAILAVLTFLGNASAQTIIQIAVPSITCAILLFLISIVISLIAIGISYTFYGLPEDHLYSRFWNKWIVLFNGISMILALIGFVAGVSVLLVGVTPQ